VYRLIHVIIASHPAIESSPKRGSDSVTRSGSDRRGVSMKLRLDRRFSGRRGSIADRVFHRCLRRLSGVREESARPISNGASSDTLTCMTGTRARRPARPVRSNPRDSSARARARAKRRRAAMSGSSPLPSPLSLSLFLFPCSFSCPVFFL